MDADPSPTCDEAVVLALPVARASPLDHLAGLPLALRTVLTLQKEGIARIALVVPRGDTATFARVSGDRRTRVELRAVEAESALEGVLLAREGRPDAFVVASHDVVVDPAIYRALRREAAKLDCSTLAAASTRGTKRIGPFVGASAFLEHLSGGSLDAAIDELGRAGRVRRVDAGAAFAFSIATQEGRRLAFRALFDACRKPVDGIVARHLNRHISIFISKRLVELPVTPNMLSVFTFLLGVAGAYSVAQGSYFYMLLGAFLIQCNSILDGVDGELARVRFQHSKLGQWLDTVSDDASNWLFYAGLAIGSAAWPFGHWLALLGWVSIGASALASTLFYIELARLGSGDLYALDWGFDQKPRTDALGRVLMFFRYSIKKDFALLFFLCLAVFGVLPYALIAIAGGSIGTLIAALSRNLRRAKTSPAPLARTASRSSAGR
jgi:phosphatidylglycerophosphate synthase